MTVIERPVICKDVIAYSGGNPDIEGDVVFKGGVYSPDDEPDTLDDPMRVDGELHVGGDVFFSMTNPKP